MQGPAFWLQLAGSIFNFVFWAWDTVPPILGEVFTLFLGLIIEAFPFIVLGVAVSTLIALFVKDEWIGRFVPKNRFLSHPMLALLGILIPVCQCGNIPVARRLLAKGLPVSQVVAFRLAAPIVNPITLFTTLQAFNVDPAVAWIRIGAGYAIAVAVGLGISCMRNQKSLLKEEFIAEVCDPEHEHTHKLPEALGIFQHEFIEMFRMLFVGAAVAALVQGFVPRSVIAPLGAHPLFSVIAMLGLSFIIALCSNVDAFFVLSYSQTFTLGSLLAFMTFGPTINIKILSMLRSTFTARALIMLSIAVGACSLALGLGVNNLYHPFL